MIVWADTCGVTSLVVVVMISNLISKWPKLHSFLLPVTEQNILCGHHKLRSLDNVKFQIIIQEWRSFIDFFITAPQTWKSASNGSDHSEMQISCDGLPHYPLLLFSPTVTIPYPDDIARLWQTDRYVLAGLALRWSPERASWLGPTPLPSYR